MTALEILQRVGGRDGLSWVRSNVAVMDDTVVRARALSAADVIEARIRPPAP